MEKKKKITKKEKPEIKEEEKLVETTVVEETNETHPTFDNPETEPKKRNKFLSTALSVGGIIIVGVIWNVFFSTNEVKFETRGERSDIRMVLPSGWELTNRRTAISNGDCTITPDVISVATQREAFLELVELIDESESLRIRGRNWEKTEILDNRVVYTEYGNDIFAIVFEGDDACERDFNRIQRSIRLVR